MTTKKQLKYLTVNASNKNNTEHIISLNIHDDSIQQMYAIHRSLKQHLTNNRHRKAHTKTRSEVRGGGKKPWKQKGTGRARAGSTRSPLWRGGGVIFGPRTAKYSSKINRKEKRLAINTALYNKFSKTVVTQNLLENINQPSTKNAILELKQLGININKQEKILIITNIKNNIIYRSFKNIANIELIEAKNINILSLLKADIILVTTTALNKINILNNK
uniref:Large ribosomal subunit protein uL4c n=1 Tax=Ophidocladus simpliciusculus TaxID=1261574 RepID=A0A1Z1MJL4_9FLOR|nr:ribosomal protein L4 [Ophidocladus simpliciusculus]ARW66032.1 ribosomal protein L4 [Ophidocladus simpliciusculus]